MSSSLFDFQEERWFMEKPGKVNGQSELEIPASARILHFVISQFDLTQKDLAKILKVDQSFISRIIRGKRNITLATLVAIATIVEMPIAVLVWRAIRPTTVLKSREVVYAEIDSLLKRLHPDAFCKPGKPRKETV